MGYTNARLGNLVKIDSGYAFKSEFFNRTKGLPVVRIRDVNSGSSQTLYNGEYEETYIIQNGDYLITMDGDFKVGEWQGGRALLNQRVCRISSVSNELDNRYLYYYLPKVLKGIEDKTAFVTVKHLSIKDISNIEIPLPNIKIQKKIAGVLDKAQELIDKRKEQIEKIDEFLQSVFLDLFGDPVKNSKRWKTGKIRDIVSEVNYGTSKKADERVGKYPILRMNNITYKGHWDFSNLKYIDLNDDELPKYLVYKGDLLFNRTNSKELVGKTAVYRNDRPMVYAGYLIRVRTNEKANTEYISAYLNSIHGKLVLKNMCKNIVGMSNINAQEMQNINILNPPIELQNKFAEIVEKTEAQKELMQKSLKEMENNFQSIMQKAFRGELF